MIKEQFAFLFNKKFVSFNVIRQPQKLMIRICLKKLFWAGFIEKKKLIPFGDRLVNKDYTKMSYKKIVKAKLC